MRDVSVSYVVPMHVREDAPAYIDELLAYVAQTCDRVTLTSAARRFGRCPSTLARDVRRSLSMTFGQLVRHMRMQRAAALLETGALCANRVASYCGYADVGSFYDAFEHAYGCTPAQWRARAAVEEARLMPVVA